MSNVEAEREVLGSFINNFDAVRHKLGKLCKEDFTDNVNKRVFVVIEELNKQHIPITAITINKKDNAIDLLFLIELSNSIASAHLLDHYIGILKEETTKRKIVHACTKMIEDINNNEVDDIRDCTYQLVSFLEKSVTQKRDSLVSLDKLIVSNINEMQNIANNTCKKDIMTGYSNIDARTHGIDESCMIVIGARPSVGKTAFAMNLAMKVSRTNDINVAFFSLEMSSSQIAYRAMSNIAKMSHADFKKPNILKDNFNKITAIGELGKRYKIYVDDDATAKVSDIREKCVNMKRKHGLGMIIIDYLQLMKPMSNKINRNEAISEITRDLKLFAKDIKVPIVVLSQLSRAVEGRDDKPRLSDLRDSGSIEQDADIVMLMSRSDYQNESEEEYSLVEINLPKIRNGNVGLTQFLFYKDQSLFVPIEKDLR